MPARPKNCKILVIISERNEHNYELAGIGKAVQDKFSNRRHEIVEITKELGLNNAQTRQEAALKTRLGKKKGMDNEMIREIWWDRLDQYERSGILAAKSGPAAEKKKERVLQRKH